MAGPVGQAEGWTMDLKRKDEYSMDRGKSVEATAKGYSRPRHAPQNSRLDHSLIHILLPLASHYRA